jgi:HEAT repeat protein
VSATVEALLEQLSEVGWPVRSLAELVNTRRQYPEVVPVLTEWLESLDATDIRRLPRDVEMAVRALAVPTARGTAARCLINLFRLVPESSTCHHLRWAIGNTLEVVADGSVAHDMVALATDRRYGPARQMIVLGLGRLASDCADEVLIDLLEDDQVVGHAIMALRRRRATRAVAAITPLLRHPKPWVRTEAKKTLTRIRSQTNTDNP